MSLSQYLNVPSGDYASQMLQLIWGNAWSAITSAGLNFGAVNLPQSALGDMFTILNAAILSFTTFYIMKVLYEGVAGTAHHGEWLGKQYSTFWAPIRTAGMLALIAPVSGGFCLAQVFVLAAVNLSIGVADSVANAGMQIVMTQGLMTMPDKVGNSRHLANQVFKSMVCAAAANHAAAQAGEQPWVQPVQTVNGVTTEVDFSGTKNSNLPKNVCGGLAITIAQSSGSGYTAAMTQAVQAGLQAMYADLQPAVAAVVANSFPSGAGQGGTPGSTTGGSTALTPGAVTQAAGDYDTAMYKSAAGWLATQNSTTSTWAQNIQDHGWADLGGLMPYITELNKRVDQMMNYTPYTIAVDISPVEVVAPEVGTAMTEANAYIQNENTQAVASPNPNAAGFAIAPPPSAGGSGIEAKLLSVLRDPFEGIARAVSSSFFDYKNPIGAIQTAGIAITDAAGTATIGSVIGLATTGAAGGATSNAAEQAGMGAITATAPFIGMILMLVLIPLVIAGLVMAYVIPFLPYIIYTLAVLSWSVAVIIAVVGAPLWAAAHAIPHGEGFASDTAQAGYKMLLSLVIKPTLLVFGFFLSILAFSASEFLIQHTAGPAMQILFDSAWAQGGVFSWFSGVLGMVTVVALMAGLALYAAKWSFSLIHLIPDHAMRWAGLDDLGLNEEHGHTDMGGVVAVAHRTGGDAVKKVGERAGRRSPSAQNLTSSAPDASTSIDPGQHAPAIKPPKN